jgi:hypothetical protein
MDVYVMEVTKCNITAQKKMSEKNYDILSTSTKKELYHLYYSRCLCNEYMVCLKQTHRNPTEAIESCDKLVEAYLNTKKL